MLERVGEPSVLCTNQHTQKSKCMFKAFLLLTCPGWCWCCLSCRHRSQSWSRSQSHGRSAERHLPGRKPSNRQGENTQQSVFTLWGLARFQWFMHTGPRFHLLFVVVAGHVQDEQAVAERADWDACRGRTVWMRREPNTAHVQKKAKKVAVDLWPFRAP